MLYALFIGLIAGAIAGYIRKGAGFGFIGDIVVGVIGSILGYFLLRLISPGINYGITGDIIVGVIGSLILLSLIGLVKKS